MLFVNATTADDIDCTNLGYWVGDYESAFEILTKLVADQWMLKDATVMDGQDRMAVPVDVFDGQPILVHIQALQQQWQQILTSQPGPPADSAKQRLKGWYVQLDGYYDYMLTHLEKMVLLLEVRKIRSENRHNEPFKRRLNDQYDKLLATNRKMYAQTKIDSQANRERLSRLA